jgi:putative membrane protein
MSSIAGLGPFLAYLTVSLGLIAVYLAVYLQATGHRELALIRQNNLAAAIALGGSLVGYTLPLAVSIHNAQSILDCIVWGLVALIVQVAVYLATRLLLPDVSRRIEDGETASATLLAATSLAGGIVDAAAMTY